MSSGLHERQVLHVQSQGQGPWLVLSHALGCDATLYDALAELLEPYFCVLRYEHRGHGRSQHASAPYTIADLADDAADLIRRKCAGQAVLFVGVSMGGMVAQALAARHPELVRGLVVANSTHSYDAAARVAWQQRMDAVQASGLDAIAEGAMQRWFSADFRARQPSVVAHAKQVLLACNPQQYIWACGAVAAVDCAASNTSVQCPALVIDGSEDLATPGVMSDAIAATLPHALRASLRTGHLSATEDPAGFAQLLRDFAAQLPPIHAG